MKKILVALVLLLSIAVTISSCGSSRKTGCPNNQGIVH
jgi:predicted small lipoprotein YifL